MLEDEGDVDFWALSQVKHRYLAKTLTFQQASRLDHTAATSDPVRWIRDAVVARAKPKHVLVTGHGLLRMLYYFGVSRIRSRAYPIRNGSLLVIMSWFFVKITSA